MITKVIQIPITDSSYPFASAVKRCNLEEHGYFEAEYYFEGSSNVYRTCVEGKIEVKNADCPYVNRMIIRAPKDISAFSGNVALEIINPTSNMEIDRMWILTHKEIMRNNDIYVGFTSKPNTLKLLTSFDQERYGCLEWPNPTPDVPFDPLIESIHPIAKKDINIKYETGLVWDMITDLSTLFRDDSNMNPIRGYLPQRLVLTGWSQSAGYVRRYLNSFDNCETSYYDGYLAAGGVSFMETPVNQYEYILPGEKGTARVTRCSVPFMSLQTESENANFGNQHNKSEDSDEPDFLYRNYEIAGGSHDTMSCYVDYYKDDPDIDRIASMLIGPLAYSGSHEQGNDYPMEYLFCAAHHNLFTWIKTGIAPNRCESIQTNANGENLRDGFGNSIGGVRTCLLNYPTAHYCTSDSIGLNQAPFSVNSKIEFSLFGYTRPFSSYLLKELYTNLDNYRVLVTDDTKKQVAKGFVLQADADDLVEYAVSKALERGLI